jgi:hypothetical protein
MMNKTGLLISAVFACVLTFAEEKPATAPAKVPATAAPVKQESTPAKTATFTSAGGKMLTLSYGYVISDYEDVDTDLEGWRFNALFEMNPKGGNVLQGLSIGYIETTASRSSAAQTVDYELMTIPVCYAPKLLIGKKAFKGYIQGLLGFHYSDYSRSGTLGDADTDDIGFYGGGALGGMIVLKEKFFVNAQYEAAYLSNSYYRDGVLQTVSFGVGTKF